MTQIRSESLTVPYAAVQGTFWMSFCASVSFATVYLQGLGYANVSLGGIMAAGNLLGALLGPLLAARIDRDARVSAQTLTPPLLAAQLLALLALLACPRKGVVTTAGYTLYIAFCAAVNSLNLKLYADATHHGIRVDYGFARGIGSLCYVAISVVLGLVIERTSVRTVPVAGIAITLAQLAAFWVTARRLPKDAAAHTAATPSAGLRRFVRENGRFCVLLAGTALLFYAHNTVCNFLINVTRSVGGDTSTMGVINGFMAAVEIPVMLLFTRLFGQKSMTAVLRFAFVVFSVKAAAIAAAGNIGQLTGAFVLQAPSFALYTAAIVPYVEKTIAYENAAKAQSLAFTMTTLGAVLASVGSGWLFDHTTVSATLWIACGVSVAGSVIAVCGVKKSKNENKMSLQA